MKNSSLEKMNPEQLIKAYIQAKGGKVSTIPKHALDSAIGSIEELLIFLDIEPYKENLNP